MFEQLTPAVIYAAKSTEDRNDSLSTQIEECEGLAADEGWEVVGRFSDEGFSAYSGNRGPDLRAAKALAARIAHERGTTAMLVAQAHDRFARGAGDRPGAAQSLGEVWHELRRKDVHLRTVEDDFELRDPQSVAAIGQRAMMDSRRKSKAVTKGMARRAAKGLHNGRAPLGYQNEGGHLVIVEREAAIVRRIFAAYLAGTSQKAIARGLGEDGIETKHSGVWYQGTVAKVLSNHLYMGSRSPSDWQEGTHESIIDPEKFQAAQALRTAGTRTGATRGRPSVGSHIFRRGMLRCGVCGESMVPRSGRYEAYYCVRRCRLGTASCSMPSIPRAFVDDAVRRYFEEVGLDIDATRASLAQTIQRKITEVRTLREEAERTAMAAAERLTRVRRDYTNGALTPQEWRELRELLEPEQQAACAKVQRITAREREIVEMADLRDVEAEVLRELTHLRAVIAGEVRDAESVQAMRAALLRLFESFTLHHHGEESQATAVAPHPGWRDPNLSVPGRGGFYVEPHPCAQMVESAAPEGYPPGEYVFPVMRRVPLPAKQADKAYGGLIT